MHSSEAGGAFSHEKRGESFSVVPYFLVSRGVIAKIKKRGVARGVGGGGDRRTGPARKMKGEAKTTGSCVVRCVAGGRRQWGDAFRVSLSNLHPPPPPENMHPAP